MTGITILVPTLIDFNKCLTAASPCSLPFSLSNQYGEMSPAQL